MLFLLWQLKQSDTCHNILKGKTNKSVFKAKSPACLQTNFPPVTPINSQHCYELVNCHLSMINVSYKILTNNS